MFHRVLNTSILSPPVSSKKSCHLTFTVISNFESSCFVQFYSFHLFTPLLFFTSLLLSVAQFFLALYLISFISLEKRRKNLKIKSPFILPFYKVPMKSSESKVNLKSNDLELFSKFQHGFQNDDCVEH